MSYRVDDQIRIIRKGQAVRAEYPIPPGVAGHDPQYRSLIPYDPRAANALLEKYGYKKGPDGYRRQPDGQPLVIRYASSPTERDRQFDELLKRSLDSIGVRLEIQKERFPELLKLEKRCRLMVRGAAWIADYPDGDNFMQLLYSKNIGESNNSCYASKEFDRRYEKSRTLPHGPERDQLYHEMTRIMEADGAWLLQDSRVRNALQQPNVVGFTKHPVLHAEWLYIDLDPKRAD
jgi:oligopeptide transport system substrate-binding protein